MRIRARTRADVLPRSDLLRCPRRSPAPHLAERRSQVLALVVAACEDAILVIITDVDIGNLKGSWADRIIAISAGAVIDT